MASAINKVSSVLRIVRGERDALVRTAHFKAASENVSFATIERKIMSTKTSFKRVALVAVASLGFGVLSSMAPASAAFTAWTVATGNQMQYVNTISLAQVTSAPTVGSAVVVNFGTSLGAGDTNTSSPSVTEVVINKFVGVLTSVPTNGGTQVVGWQTASGTTTALTGYRTETVTAGSSNAIHVETTTAGSGAPAASVTASTIAGVGSFRFTPTVAGVYQLTVYNQSGDGASTGAQDSGEMSSVISITVGAAAGYSAGLSTAVSASRFADGFADGDSSTAELTVAKAVTTVSGIIKVTLKTSAAAAATGLTVAGTISGSGLILVDTSTSDAAGTVRTGSVVLGSTENVAYIHVSGDGSAGVGVVTIQVTDSVGTSTLTTKSFTFVGAATSYSRTADTGKILLGVGETTTIDLDVVDALGNKAADFTTVVSSSSSLIATVAAGTTASASAGSAASTVVTGVGAGTATITICNTTCAATGALSKTFSITVTKTTAKAFTLTFDKATYAPGEKMILTVDAKDANGAGVADGTRALLSSAGITANAAITGIPAASANVALAGGVKAFTMYAPLISGEVVVTATEGAAVDAVIAGGTGAVVTGSATVSGGSADAALDAANEATDAAYAAADAADNATQAAVDAGAAAALAQESADAALAAVTDLGIKVTGLLDKLSASLANIYKIIKAIQAKK